MVYPRVLRPEIFVARGRNLEILVKFDLQIKKVLTDQIGKFWHICRCENHDLPKEQSLHGHIS